MKTLKFDIKMDIDKIIKEKVDPVLEDTVFFLAETIFEYISINAQNVAFQFGSPVFTGRYHASHRASLNTPDTTVAPEGVYSNSAPLSQVTSLRPSFKIGDSIIISNSLPYAGDIEFNKASPFKTPEGVYRVSVEAAKVKFTHGAGRNGR